MWHRVCHPRAERVGERFTVWLCDDVKLALCAAVGIAAGLDTVDQPVPVDTGVSFTCRSDWYLVGLRERVGNLMQDVFVDYVREREQVRVGDGTEAKRQLERFAHPR